MQCDSKVVTLSVMRKKQTYSAFLFSSERKNGKVQKIGYRMECQEITGLCFSCPTAPLTAKSCNVPPVSMVFPKHIYSCSFPLDF
jgi:ABC-type antimicrobial peptide transport system ATPase subunit